MPVKKGKGKGKEKSISPVVGRIEDRKAREDQPLQALKNNGPLEEAVTSKEVERLLKVIEETPYQFLNRNEPMIELLNGWVKRLYDQGGEQTIQLNETLIDWLEKFGEREEQTSRIVNPIPTGPLPSLLVDGFDIHQVWEQIETRNAVQLKFMEKNAKTLMRDVRKAEEQEKEKK
eukprot:CAMPEP_0201535472 /NCGR_PEP_ID=MMETSP0161_2-20130828/59138_1 /ASSEMBLY_ACC=CAM_ASM_000251 /TAXON_ID=180227 /ORGANISM="Neoparamoeba aestuarina, Strain SoJaBio B1-5/56/2" /LENGTH=174 /DNA_ID=CAMNT_0047940665 /DNA_START=51 /DNA_END=572 /DNA_ORIENTATION=+